MLDGIKERAWVEVDLSAMRENFRLVKAALGEGKKLCCVVKANAYGHGATVISHLYETLGADLLAVSNIEEALELRLDGITLPILILGYTAPRCAETLAEYDIIQCVYSLDYAKALSQVALTAGVTVKAHLKLDSGMGRLGFTLREGDAMEVALCEMKTALSLEGLSFDGIFTHFAMSDMGKSGKAYTERQIALFTEALFRLEETGGHFSLVHAANSAAIFAYPHDAFDMARAGIVLYGYPPSSEVKADGLTPALSLKTVVDHIKTVKAGESISYGGIFKAEHDMKVATIPIGYADGLWRSMGERGLSVGLCGKRVPIIGRICMDQCMLDVSALDDLTIGEVVTVYGEGGEAVSTLAETNQTIVYELLCALGERLPRVYLENGIIVSVKDRILPE